MTTNKPPKEIVSLDEARAARSDYARDWTPLYALKKAVESIESGEMTPDMVYIAFRQKHGEGMASYDCYCAGGDDIHFAGLLTTHIHQLLTED